MKSKYKSLSEWSKADINGYQAARNKDLISKICESFGWELPKQSKPNNYWTIELCKTEALKYNTRTEWQKKHKASYQAARKKNWLDIVSPNMKGKNPIGYWIEELCYEEALKYNSRGEWKKNHPTSYHYSNTNGWLIKHSEHMEVKSKKNRPSSYWVKKNCIEDALKYNSISEWAIKSKGSYQAAIKKGWVDECANHMLKYGR